MNNNLQRRRWIHHSGEELPYFSRFLQQAYENGFIEAVLLEKVQLQSVALLAKRVERYTFGESSSVPVTKAEEILQSVYYSAGIAVEEIGDEEKAITVLREQGLEAFYTLGRSYIDEKLALAKRLLQDVKDSAIPAYHHAYQDTVFCGLPQFFASYDADFAAQSTPCSIDYPLSCPISRQTGVSYIVSYLQSLLIENRFCQKFSLQNTEALLRGYDRDYAEQFFNIFDLVLTNALGCLLAQKDVLSLAISEADRDYLQQQLGGVSREQLAARMTGTTKNLCGILGFTDAPIHSYIADAGQKLFPILSLALAENRLEAILITPRQKVDAEKVRFVPAPPMEDEAFRRLTEELRSCRFVEDKIRLIQRDVESYTDLCDLLAAGCLFNDEFKALFAVLTNEQLALLYRQVLINKGGGEEFLKAEELLWQRKLVSFCQGLSKERKKVIESLAYSLGSEE